MIEEAISAANVTSSKDITSLMLYSDGSNTALTVEMENRKKKKD